MFFLSCKANARVKLAKTGHGPHSLTLVVICVVRLLFVLFCILFVCKCVLPPCDNPIAVNKYISYPPTPMGRTACTTVHFTLPLPYPFIFRIHPLFHYRNGTCYEVAGI